MIREISESEIECFADSDCIKKVCGYTLIEDAKTDEDFYAKLENNEYHFDRKYFCDIFCLLTEISGEGSYNLFDKLIYCIATNVETNNFLFFHEEEDCYCFNKNTKEIVGWYKLMHCGRANFCSNSNMTEEDLVSFVELIKKDLNPITKEDEVKIKDLRLY